MDFDWKSIDTVLLDMDGTLLDLHYDSHFWLDYLPSVWSRENKLGLAESKAKFGPIFEQHAGTLNWYCVDFWSEELGLDIMRYKKELSHKIAYRPTAQAFLSKCGQQSSDVRLVTNAHRKVLELKNEMTGIYKYFHQTICSHELSMPKEDPKFWQALNAKQAFDPLRTLFIDDNESVLESASSYGIKHLYSIAEPDSQRPRRLKSKFPMLDRLHSPILS